MEARNSLLGSAVLVYFVIALEVLIMISPFAGFFYALFNPVLLQVAGHPATRWLSAFYLPHMVLPRAYIMQGMIADTGGDWKLFEQHRTFGMILDWVFNPFGHLRGGHHGMHAAHMAMALPGAGGNEAMTRRLIFLSIEGVPVTTPADLFAINAVRVPAFMADVDIHDLRIFEIRDLAPGSGWGTVPTPVF